MLAILFDAEKDFRTKNNRDFSSYKTIYKKNVLKIIQQSARKGIQKRNFLLCSTIITVFMKLVWKTKPSYLNLIYFYGASNMESLGENSSSLKHI